MTTIQIWMTVITDIMTPITERNDDFTNEMTAITDRNDDHYRDDAHYKIILKN